jgi:hypothetical protein
MDAERWSTLLKLLLEHVLNPFIRLTATMLYSLLRQAGS